MSTTLPALRGHIGKTTYYLMFMSALELVKLSHIPSHDEWGQLSVEERYQRELNFSRVKNTIVPYLLKDEDRFLGSVILASDKWDNARFEAFNSFGNEKLPYRYRHADNIGYYTFDGDESLVILDGQHRVRALELAIKGEEGQNDGYNSDIASDMISVLLIENETKKARKIFTKVNSNARKTTTAQTLTTDDDDIVAILSRKVADEIITPRLVGLSASQLTERNSQFIALPTIASGTEAILLHSTPFKTKERRFLPSETKQKIYSKRVMDDWKYLVKNVVVWRDALRDKEDSGDDYRKQLRADYLCMRPMPMQAIIEAFAYVTNMEFPISREAAVKGINGIPWHTNARLWDRVLLAGGKIQVKNRTLVTDMIKYIIRDYKCDSQDHEEALLEHYRKMFPSNSRKDVTLEQIKHRAVEKSPL